MSGQKYLTIEDKIIDVLDGGKQTDTLDFITFIRTNGLSLKAYDEYGYGWAIEYKTQGLGFIKIDAADKEMRLWSGGVFNTDFTDDNEFNCAIWANVVTCPQATCSTRRQCGEQQEHGGIIFGKEYNSTCYSPLGFFNPDAQTINNIKKLLLFLKERTIQGNR